MAAILMQNWETGITVKQLVKESDWLKRQAANLGAYVDWPGNTSQESVVRHYLSLHTNILTVKDDFILPRLVKPSAHVKGAKDDHVMLNAATNIILASYRNQLMHVFVRVAMVSMSINGCVQETMSKGMSP
jgi:glycerone phosphate O-acyltransferase